VQLLLPAREKVPAAQIRHWEELLPPSEGRYLPAAHCVHMELAAEAL
jgi:hypothetical protein